MTRSLDRLIRKGTDLHLAPKAIQANEVAPAPPLFLAASPSSASRDLIEAPGFLDHLPSRPPRGAGSSHVLAGGEEGGNGHARKGSVDCGLHNGNMLILAKWRTGYNPGETRDVCADLVHKGLVDGYH